MEGLTDHDFEFEFHSYCNIYTLWVLYKGIILSVFHFKLTLASVQKVDFKSQEWKQRNQLGNQIRANHDLGW